MCLGTVGVVVRVWEEDGVPLALVDTGPRVERACLLAQPDVEEGTDVLVHMGFVVEVLDAGSAAEAIRLRSGAERVIEGGPA
jgi:hydrogenase maturation factor